jgi:hypothetical protein
MIRFALWLALAVGAVAVTTAAGRADYAEPSQVAGCAPHFDLCPTDETTEEAPTVTADTMTILTWFALIGDVPVVVLGAASSDPDFGNPTIPDGGDVTTTATETVTAATTPEPAAWLLGVLGAGLAVMASCWRRVRLVSGAT